MSDTPYDPRKTPEPDFRAPDVIGTVEGWRAWAVDLKLPRFGVPPKLRSVSFGAYYWTPRRRAMAECEKCGQDVPGEHCTCGFYSAKNLRHLMGMGYHVYDPDNGAIRVVGRLACWGKVVEGTQGWRTQYAYPVKLYVPFEAHHLAIPLKKAYGVPIRLKNLLVSPELAEEE